MTNEPNPLSALDGDKSLGTAEVKALFEAYRSIPNAAASLREAFAKVKDRLTPEGRVVYRRELSKLLQKRPAIPKALRDLDEGEYGIVLSGDDCTQGLATLRRTEDAVRVEVPVSDVPFALVAQVDADGRLEGSHAAEGFELQLSGELAVRDGYVFLDTRVTGVARGRKLRVVLSGVGDARASRA